MFGIYPAKPARAPDTGQVCANGSPHARNDPARRGRARRPAALCQALTRAGYQVTRPATGRKPSRCSISTATAIDLLLTDLRMPYMGGAELAQHAARAAQDAEVDLRVRAIRPATRTEMPSDFLAKPFSRDDLLAKVREVLDRR